MVGNAGNGDEVTGQFDIDRPLEPQRGVQHAVDFLEGGLRVAQTVEATVSWSKTFFCVSNSRTLWCSSGFFSRSFIPGAPLMTTTGDFSAKASAVGLATLRPPTQ